MIADKFPCLLLCLQGTPEVVLEVGGCRNHWRSSCQPPSTSKNPTNGETSQRRQGPRLRSPGCLGTQMHGPTVLAICLRNVLFSVGPVCSQLLWGEGLWLLGIYKLDALNLCCCDLSEKQTGAGCFQRAVFSSSRASAETPTCALCKTREALQEPASVLSSAIPLQSHGLAGGVSRPLPSHMLFLLLECPSLFFLKASQAIPMASSDPLGSATPSSELPELSIIPLLALISLTQNDLFTCLFSPG